MVDAAAPKDPDRDAGNPYQAPSAGYEPPVAQPVARPLSGPEEVLQTIIPVRNMPALIGYYLGLFSCFPVLGFPLAIAGVILGWKGIRRAWQHPEAKGGIHAWVGLICGSIGLLLNLLIICGIVAASVGALD